MSLSVSGAPNSVAISAALTVKLAGNVLLSALNSFTFAAFFLITTSTLLGGAASAKKSVTLNLPWKAAWLVNVMFAAVPPASRLVETTGTSSIPIFLGIAPSSFEHPVSIIRTLKARVVIILILKVS